MNNKRITLGIGIVLATLAAFTSVAVAEQNVSYFEPQVGRAVTGDYDLMSIYYNVTDGTPFQTAQIHLVYDPSKVSIPDGSVVKGCPPPAEGTHCWNYVSSYFVCNENDPVGRLWLTMSEPQEAVYVTFPPPAHWEYETIHNFVGPMKIKMCDIYVTANGTGTPGVSPFDFSYEFKPADCPLCQNTLFAGSFLGDHCKEHDWYPVNGTFIHIGEPVHFEKELVPGWNLISLPLTPNNNSTSAVLGNDAIGYDVVYRYDAASKKFESMMDGTMDTGIGYFVNITAAGTWNYTGIPYTSMDIYLKQGLNCIGWMNASANLPDAIPLISGKYNYVARWDADDPKYKVYDANAPEGVAKFIDFTTMERGNGYWIAAKEDCTLHVG